MAESIYLPTSFDSAIHQTFALDCITVEVIYSLDMNTKVI